MKRGMTVDGPPSSSKIQIYFVSIKNTSIRTAIKSYFKTEQIVVLDTESG